MGSLHLGDDRGPKSTHVWSLHVEDDVPDRFRFRLLAATAANQSIYSDRRKLTMSCWS